MPHDTGTVYKLIDPRDNSIFYIGQTYYELPARLTYHLNDKKPSARKTKIDEIQAQGLKPIIEPIETVSLVSNYHERIKFLLERERYWIQWHRNNGHPLLNYNPVKGNTLESYSPQMLKNKLASLTKKEQELMQELAEIREKKHAITNVLNINELATISVAVA